MRTEKKIWLCKEYLSVYIIPTGGKYGNTIDPEFFRTPFAKTNHEDFSNFNLQNITGSKLLQQI